MKKVYKILLIVLILIVFLLPIKVQASSFKLNVTANKTSLEPGDTLELTLSLADIDAGDLGINTVEGMLEYDKTIFEEITSADITSLNNWSITYNNEETDYKGKMLAVIIQDGVTQDQDIGKIKFKVKEGLEDTSTSIKIKDIASNDGTTLIKETDKEIKFEVVNNKNNSDNTNVENNIKVESENLSTGTLPQTGESDYVLWIIGILLIVICIVAYVRFRKLDK